MLSWFVNCRHKPVRDTFQQRDNDSSAVLTLAIHSVHSVQFPYCTVFLSIPFCINRFHIVLQKQGGRGVEKVSRQHFAPACPTSLFSNTCAYQRPHPLFFTYFHEPPGSGGTPFRHCASESQMGRLMPTLRMQACRVVRNGA